MRKKLISWGLFFALGEAVYVALVALVMKNANQIFGEKPEVLSIIAFLILFVLSAAVSGALIFGKPALLYLEGKKRESLELFGFTLGWMFVLFAVVLATVTLWR